MKPFRFAQDFFSNEYLPQQVSWALALLLLSLVAIMAGLVLFRRAIGKPHVSERGAPPPAGVAAFERYEIGARLWHIGLVGILLALGISGAAFYAPGIVGPVPLLGISWLTVHLVIGVAFIIGIVIHTIKALLADPLQMWFNRLDREQLAANARYYLGLPHAVPKLGKYGVWSKVFHVALVVLAFVMIESGISLGLDTLGWASIDRSWQRWQRLLHDLGTYGFLFLVAAHVFWQLLKSWSQQKSMLTGTIPPETFIEHHDWDRWKPDAHASATSGRTSDHGG